MTPLSTAIFQEEDDMAFLSSIFNTECCTVQPQAIQDGKGEQSVASKKRRRRRRARKEGEESKKRRLSAEQAKFLETCFVSERKLESGRKARLASEAGLDPKQVAVWFQNRRARWKSKQLEGEYNKLKLQLHQAVVDKCNLEAEMLKMKEQLAEAMAKITLLTAAGGSCDTISGPTTSFSVDTAQCQPSTAEGPLSYLHEHNYVNMLDWDYNFYGM